MVIADRRRQVSLTYTWLQQNKSIHLCLPNDVRIEYAFIKNWYNITEENICISFSTSQNSKSKQTFAEGLSERKIVAFLM